MLTPPALPASQLTSNNRIVRGESAIHVVFLEDEAPLRLIYEMAWKNIDAPDRPTLALTSEPDWALGYIERHPKNTVLVVDLNLGREVCGAEFSRVVRRMHPTLPIIIMTGMHPDTIPKDWDKLSEAVIYKGEEKALEKLILMIPVVTMAAQIKATLQRVKDTKFSLHG